jgi:peptidoglycan/LPS O-acetylase OafA/YrhL
MGATGKKLLYLESLRGLAALMVVFTHFVGSFFPAVMGGANYPSHSKFDIFIHSTPLTVFVNGNFAVCIFFVLSGFVLTRTYFVTRDAGILTRGAVKRYFRLMPPVAVSVFIAYALLKLGLFYNQQAAQISGSPGLAEVWTFAASMKEALNQAFYGTFLNDIAGTASYNPVLWTMKVEFVGSFLVFGAAALFGGYARRGVIYAILMLLLWNQYYAAFVIGLALADLTTGGRWQSWLARVKWPVWAGLMLVGLALGAYPSAPTADGTMFQMVSKLVHTAQPYMLWHIAGAALLTLGLLGWRRAQAVMSWGPFVELGRQSFGLYLTHLLVIATFSSYLFTRLHVTFGYRTSFVIMVAVSLVLIFMVSWLYTKWVDEPAIKLAGWVVRRRSRQAMEPATKPVLMPGGVTPTPTEN